MSKDAEELLVRVATAANEALARMWAEALESQGISCLVKPVGGPGISGVWAAGIFEHELWVRASQSEEAAALLHPYDGPHADLTVKHRRRRKQGEAD